VIILVAAGAVWLGVVMRSDGNDTSALDGYTRAEINRMEVLRDLAS
jgi:hypothetical protein